MRGGVVLCSGLAPLNVGMSVERQTEGGLLEPAPPPPPPQHVQNQGGYGNRQYGAPPSVSPIRQYGAQQQDLVPPPPPPQQQQVNPETMEMGTINIERAAGAAWGFSVESETFTYPSGAMFTRTHVAQVFPESPADKAGLVPADLVLAVNEQRLDALEHEDVCVLLGSEPTNNIKLMIERPRAGPTAVLKQLTITRSETGQPLGFSTSANTNTGHTTADEVLPGGLADQAGLLPDDRLLMINDSVLHRELPHTEIVAMLGTQRDVDIVFERLAPTFSNDLSNAAATATITIQRGSPSEVWGLFWKVKTNNNARVMKVKRVVPGSAAHRSGVCLGDRIFAIDGTTTQALHDGYTGHGPASNGPRRALANRTTATLTIIPAVSKATGNTSHCSVLGQHAVTGTQAHATVQMSRCSEGARWGIVPVCLHGHGEQQWRGWLVDVVIHSPAFKAGIRTGDRIQAINGVEHVSEKALRCQLATGTLADVCVVPRAQWLRECGQKTCS